MVEPETGHEEEGGTRNSAWRRVGRHALRAALVLGLPLLALSLLPLPYVWILGIGGLSLVVLGVSRRKLRRGVVYFNLGILLVALGAAELVVGLRRAGSRTHYGSAYEKGYSEPHDFLGYAPIPNTRTPSSLWFEDEKLYDVVYTIGDDGLRIAPPVSEDAPAGSLLFFGGSFMFGEGRNDEEAVPYVVGTLLAGRYRIYNFAFHGYGPHQMLSALEHGRVKATVTVPPRHAVYLALEEHVLRSWGETGWDRHGPRYVLDGDRGVRLDGRFDDRSAFERFMRRVLRKSSLVKRWIQTYRSTAQLDLFAEIVLASKTSLQEAWPECTFDVILWDDDPEACGKVEAALEERGVRVHRASAALPGLREDRLPYVIHRYDGHPRAATAEALARYVTQQIVGR